MKYEWNANVLTVTHGEGEGAETLTLNLDDLSPAVIAGATKLGLRTALRNATAGKMDDEAEGWKALKAKAQVFSTGVWEKAGEAKGKVELTQEEIAACLAEVIIAAKRAQGDKRTDAELNEAFVALPEEKKMAILTALKKPIDKKLAQRLKDKKALGKTVAAGNAVDF